MLVSVGFLRSATFVGNILSCKHTSGDAVRWVETSGGGYKNLLQIINFLSMHYAAVSAVDCFDGGGVIEEEREVAKGAKKDT